MSGPTKAQTKDEAETKAAAAGLVCILPLDNELLLDIDDDSFIPNEKVLEVLNELFGVVSMCNVESRSGHRHVYIRLRTPITLEDRLIAQAALGSDPVRELLSLKQVKAFSEVTTTLFELPESAEIVRKWREQSNECPF